MRPELRALTEDLGELAAMLATFADGAERRGDRDEARTARALALIAQGALEQAERLGTEHDNQPEEGTR